MSITTHLRLLTVSLALLLLYIFIVPQIPFRCHTEDVSDPEEGLGLLVQVSFDITVFTLPAYQRGSLPRPSLKSHLEDGFALRCFQRLS